MTTRKRIYLDYNATAPCRDEVVARMVAVMSGAYANATSLHQEGQRARYVIEEARARIASIVGATPLEIVFTSGGTEADNLAVFGAIMASTQPCPHVITSAIEHPAVLEACRVAETRGIATVTVVACDPMARIEPESVAAALRPDTTLLSVMHANNEVGTVQSIRRIAEVAHEQGVTVHCDAVQSLGRIPVNVNELGVDLLSMSGHKLGGPRGIGALYVRTGTPLAPLLVGGPQEQERRAGTENAPAIAGFAEATELAVHEQPGEAHRLAALKMELWNMLQDIPGIHLNGDLATSLPNTLNIAFEGLNGEDLMQSLDLAGVAVSTGAACAAGAGKPSHVLEAMGQPASSRSRGPIRIGMGLCTTRADISRCADLTRVTVARLTA